MQGSRGVEEKFSNALIRFFAPSRQLFQKLRVTFIRRKPRALLQFTDNAREGFAMRQHTRAHQRASAVHTFGRMKQNAAASGLRGLHKLHAQPQMF